MYERKQHKPRFDAKCSQFLDQRFKLNGYKIQTKNGLEQNKKWVRALSVLMYAGLLTGPVCPLN